MLQAILDFLKAIWDTIAPFRILNCYEGGVRLRLGHFKEELGPGFHWVIPMVDTIMTWPTNVLTKSSRTQSITTADGVAIVVSAIIKFRVGNVRAFLLDIFEAGKVLDDLAAGGIRRLVKGKTWEQVQVDDLDQELTQAVKEETRRIGVTILSVTLVDCGKLRSLRLMMDRNED